MQRGVRGPVDRLLVELVVGVEVDLATWESSWEATSLRCETAGHVYMPLDAHCATGDGEWVVRAAERAEDGARHEVLADDALTGETGCTRAHAGLAAELLDA
jgi:hypothetical protein